MTHIAKLCWARPLGVAVSGGSDSMALLALLLDQIAPTDLRVATVDHGLRPEAAQEAAQVAAFCASRAVDHETLTLRLEGGTGLQARARTARYDALAEWARDNNLQQIALGHSKTDVAETFLIRLARGSGVDGLASMAQERRHGGVCFVRPLLDRDRSDLQEDLRRRAIDWISDPSNEDPAYTRSRIRSAGSTLAELGLTQDRLVQTAQWMQAASEVLDKAADDWICAYGANQHGDAVLDSAALQKAPLETRMRIVSRALCAISGNTYRPRSNALQTALGTQKTTLHGCLLYKDRNSLRITREYQTASQACAKHSALWDHRWTIKGPLTASMSIKPLGQEGLNQIGTWRDTALLPRLSLLASPSVWIGPKLIAAPLAAPSQNWTATAPNPLHLSR